MNSIESVSLDTCADCGAGMNPAPLGNKPAGWVDPSGQTYCQCVGCGARAGHRDVPTTATDGAVPGVLL